MKRKQRLRSTLRGHFSKSSLIFSKYANLVLFFLFLVWSFHFLATISCFMSFMSSILFIIIFFSTFSCSLFLRELIFVSRYSGLWFFRVFMFWKSQILYAWGKVFFNFSRISSSKLDLMNEMSTFHTLFYNKYPFDLESMLYMRRY